MTTNSIQSQVNGCWTIKKSSLDIRAEINPKPDQILANAPHYYTIGYHILRLNLGVERTAFRQTLFHEQTFNSEICMFIANECGFSNQSITIEAYYAYKESALARVEARRQYERRVIREVAKDSTERGHRQLLENEQRATSRRYFTRFTSLKKWFFWTTKILNVCTQEGNLLNIHVHSGRREDETLESLSENLDILNKSHYLDFSILNSPS
ncbi:hypothetical protein BDA99DRAFT_540923 [Phascolomyces articulosus]|uniref:Uncharacterized protein n=1 Tax=Phascolomyces articulosus TaxID=60185 RepID=A0AAD5PA81_9FUNG|nr:hypothetical protein BDA99DRAFT_540923 [Phascolomyces articulosus]